MGEHLTTLYTNALVRTGSHVEAARAVQAFLRERAEARRVEAMEREHEERETAGLDVQHGSAY